MLKLKAWLFPSFVLVWGLLLGALARWSYVLVDTNLTLLNKPFFIVWQARRWLELGDPLALAQQYGFLVLGWWSLFVATLAVPILQKEFAKGKFLALILVVSVGLLLLGHNAHSRDIYNYLFNAKMVVVYHADPHVQNALDFSQDVWTRFMHNTHTSAPYGRLWTWVSVVPFVISGAGSSFLLSYLMMRGWMVLGWFLFLGATWWALRSTFLRKSGWLWRWQLVALHPLILMETLLNGHNDVWMLAPVVAAYALAKQKRKAWHWPAIFLLFGISVALKYVTILLLPLFILLALQEVWQLWGKGALSGLQTKLALLNNYWGDLAALLMVIPLVTERSQQFNPWYASWFLAWVPFARWTWLRWALLGLSFTSQLRYLPWIANAFQYTPQIQFEMRLITWSGFGIGLLLWFLWRLSRSIYPKK